jgi:hypothetical protein
MVRISDWDPTIVCGGKNSNEKTGLLRSNICVTFIFATPLRCPSRPGLPAPILSFVSSSARVRQRIHVDLITVRYLAEGKEAIGHLKNVSRAGVFVRAVELPSKGAAVALQFRAPDGSLVDLRGEVCWTSEEVLDGAESPGFGVRLHEPPQAYRKFFVWVLKRAEQEKGDAAQLL